MPSSSPKPGAVSIDRSTPWVPEQLGASFAEDRCEKVWENPEARQIVEIDFSQVSLLPLIEGGTFVCSLTQQESDQRILNQLKAYKGQGYILLDEAVVVTLLKNPDSVSQAWRRMTDSDTYDESSATIRFDGSIFKLKGQAEEFVLTPFTARGYWHFGYDQRLPAIPQEPSVKTDILKAFTAAIKRSE